MAIHSSVDEGGALEFVCHFHTSAALRTRKVNKTATRERYGARYENACEIEKNTTNSSFFYSKQMTGQQKANNTEG